MKIVFNPLPDNKILDWYKLKSIADEIKALLKMLVWHLSKELMKEISHLKK